ncbi:unnamed protein product [Lactuca saligna]|uniref:Uncharacterized protein n=1 Tax=Lactuca saligna TaxID=75948 RepID=A0AA35ZHX8_LACSI|nr:unnamed protein product [Lactuca saligna]
MQDMDISYRKSCMAFGIVAVLFVFVMFSRDHLFQGQCLSSREHAFSKNQFMTATNRRLLALPADYDIGGGGDGYGDGDGGSGGDGDDDRIQPQYCSADNIYISQGQTPPLPSGIPTYSVIIQNICMSGSCIISDIHLSCGWFSSARLINPNIFKRISYNDCLVNNGNPISPGQTIYFQYANTYPYPMSVASLSCQ